MNALELNDIQGFVLFAYASLPHSAYLHVTLPETAQPGAWVKDILGEIRPASARHTKRKDRGEDLTRVHVAFTSLGLARFGLSEAEIASFPREMQEGMADPARAHVLGDEGANAPATWEFGRDDHRTHAILMLFAKTDEELGVLRRAHEARIETHGGAVVHSDTAHVHSSSKEHLGFRDGISQPHVQGSPRPKRGHEDEVAAGDFVLGYTNAYGETPPSPIGHDGFDIGKNGTYLVFRKLAQDVGGFWRYLQEQATPEPGETEDHATIKLAAKLVGRWPSGAPVAKYPHRDVEGTALEKFGFREEDPHGHACPFGAHIRRGNPRDMLEPSPEESLAVASRHRILRRGRPYGPRVVGSVPRPEADDHERGLLFLALNTSIRRQFEFLQQTWINSQKFAGLYDERDPLMSSVDPDDRRLTLQGAPARRRLLSMPRFVTLRGGAYFFLPGLKALAWIARRAP